jgi:xanthine dehydrogenase YagR molybdenum-binding subunit
VIGIGEPVTIPTAAAIANAVANALGVRVNSLPITPARVLAALGKDKLSTT